jgi:hypothetical protein
VTFSEWYASNIEPAVIQNANQLPDPEQRALVLKAARESMAACWNAAVEASWGSLVGTPLPGIELLASQICDAMNAIKVKP